MGTSVFRQTEDDSYTLAGYIPSDEEIDIDTSKQIRDKYPLDEEAKLHRLALEAVASGASIPASFTEYDSYVKDCIEDGRLKKLIAEEDRASLDEVIIPGNEGSEERTIYVRRTE